MHRAKLVQSTLGSGIAMAIHILIALHIYWRIKLGSRQTPV